MLPKTAITLAVAFPAISAAAPTISKRIVGGEDAKIDDFPSMVYIPLGNDDDCGGILLNKYTVLTAAQCLGRMKINNKTAVRAGVADLKKGGRYSRVRGIKMHPDFDIHDPYSLHDIGLLYLKEGFDESKTIAYVTPPVNGSDPEVDSKGIQALGWGFQDYEQVHPTTVVHKLSKVELDIFSREHCQSRLWGTGKPGAETIVCAGGRGKNVCKNDYGGPLIDEKKRVVGIASLLIKDQGDNYCNLEPSVFTSVGSHSDWINENLETKHPESTGEQTNINYAEFPSPTKPLPTRVPTASDFPENMIETIKEACEKRGLGSNNSCPPVAYYCLRNGWTHGYSSMDACMGAFKEAGLMSGTENKGTENKGTENQGTENQGTENKGTENKGTEKKMCSST